MRPVSSSRINRCSIIALVICAPVSWAQDEMPEIDSSMLTVDALVTWVLEENQGLSAARSAVEAAMHRIEPAGSLDDPMFTIGVAPRSSEQNVDFSQRLPWPGTLKAREAVARYEAVSADSSVGTKELELVAAAKSAYAEWYFAARGLEIHFEVLALVDELIATAEARYAAGRALQQDVLQAEVERAELETQELALRRQQTAALARINALLNRAPDAPLGRAAPIAVRRPMLGAEALQAQSIDRHPELDRLNAEMAAATGRVTVARKAFYPDFQFRAGYNTLWEEADKRPTLGVTINIPFDRTKRRATLARSEAERRRVESLLDDERARLAAEVRRAHAEVSEAVGRIEIHESRLVPLANQYLQAAVSDYQSGTGAFLNVVTAEQRVLRTELSLERTRADYLRRAADLERLTGGPLVWGPASTEGED